MMFLSIRGFIATAVALALLAASLPVGAQEPDTIESATEAPRMLNKLLDLAGCAVSIALIETGSGAVLAFVTCSKAAADWWTE